MSCSVNRGLTLDITSPCGPVNASVPVVPCCANGDACLENGICHYFHELDGGSGYYAAGCTDEDWKGGNCVHRCADQGRPDIVPIGGNTWACCKVNDDNSIDCTNPTTETYVIAAATELALLYSLPGEGFAYTSLPLTSPTSNPTIATASTFTTSTSQTQTPTQNPDSSDNTSNALSPAASAGIGVGAGLVVINIGVVLFLLYRRSRKRKAAQPDNGPFEVENYPSQQYMVAATPAHTYSSAGSPDYHTTITTPPNNFHTTTATPPQYNVAATPIHEKKVELAANPDRPELEG
ncbi:hypothetical protein F5Y18DRAFT_12817 [Xylariaceae sp. FL1019]|nr:hypothetical protein F5Y18DRAFT_12817 [Xylariaceae sp. FL1019]